MYVAYNLFNNLLHYLCNLWTYSLIVDYSIWHDCHKECDTKIWIYCLLSILLGFDKIYIRKKIVLEYGLLILSYGSYCRSINTCMGNNRII